MELPEAAAYIGRWRPSSVPPGAAAFARQVVTAAGPPGRGRAARDRHRSRAASPEAQGVPVQGQPALYQPIQRPAGSYAGGLRRS